MANSSGSISVIIPTRNRRHLIGTALESVRNQTLTPLEVIVVDQQSDDGTVEYLSQQGVRWLSDTRRGAGFARQLGVENSVGDFILFLDSDDWLLPHALEVLHDAMTPTVDLVFGKYRTEDMTEQSPHHDSLVGPAPTPPTTLIRRDVFARFGGFAGDNFSFPRWVVTSRVNGMSEKKVNEVVAHRRIHDSNVSVQPGSSEGLFNLIRLHRQLTETAE